jgi:hypothetical protein
MNNGDRIRSMTNEELAIEFETIQTTVYMVLIEQGQLPPFIMNGVIDSIDESRESWLKWLNKETNKDKKPDFTNHTGNALDYPN